jgi:hypothetical protein
MKRLAGAAKDGDRSGPAPGQKGELAHGLALRVYAARSRLLSLEHKAQREDERCRNRSP